MASWIEPGSKVLDLGCGEGDLLYFLKENRQVVGTGIERVVKFYYPDRYPDPRRAIRLARKFHRLRRCSLVLQYHHYG